MRGHKFSAGGATLRGNRHARVGEIHSGALARRSSLPSGPVIPAKAGTYWAY